ncbi:hypothetical protein TW73_01430 [Pseudoalteromonas piscicida]|nr:hypothetical protein TW73_01430 [Pseudoalteromonas piscicida]
MNFYFLKKPCGGIWFLRSDVYSDAGLLFFGCDCTAHGPHFYIYQTDYGEAVTCFWTEMFQPKQG